MRAFGQQNPGRATEHGPYARLGATSSYLALLRCAPPGPVAFADQDDVWLPEKLARAVAALAAAPPGPALYCARQILTDAALRPLAVSRKIRRPPGFAAALAQNIATGCTVVLNAPAARLVAHSEPPAATWHDWWSYLLVAGAGGTVIADDAPVILYRQHGRNAVGAPKSLWRRGRAAWRRGPRPFLVLFDAHTAALLAHADRLTPAALTVLSHIATPSADRRALRVRGLRRQGWTETLAFRLWIRIR